MIRKNKGGIEWLEFELLQDLPLRHAVFTRKGGVSEGPYASLNTDARVGDREEAVFENVMRMKRALGIEEVVFGNQVHGKEVKVVRHLSGKDSLDGFITDRKRLGLAIRHADCQAAIFYDPFLHVLANIHSGWRGNVQNIYKSAVELLEKQFGSKPENLLACISPSLGPDSAEFVNYDKEFPEHFWSFQSKPLYFDLWQIAESQLLDLGILSSHIEIAKICTYESSSDFFSFRRERLTGRNATIAFIN